MSIDNLLTWTKMTNALPFIVFCKKKKEEKKKKFKKLFNVNTYII